MSCTALIPAHNEARTIRAVVTATLPLVDAVIVVDDGSTDGTAAALDGLPVQIVRHEVNAGKGQRLAQGLALAFATGAAQVVLLDADGQHDPADIPAFRTRAAQAPQALVIGDRSADMAAMPRGRARGIRFGNFFIGWACGRRIRDAQCGMRLMPRAVWAALDIPARDRRGFVFETAMLLHTARAGFAFAPVPIRARYAGFVQRPSHFRPWGDTLAIAGTVTRFLLAHRLCLRGLLIVTGIVR